MKLSKRNVQLMIRRFYHTDKKASHAEQILGCDKKTFREYINKKLTHEMLSGESWEFDHLAPVDLFNPETIDEWKIVSNYKNIIPMLKSDNKTKGGATFLAIKVLENKERDEIENVIYLKCIEDFKRWDKYL